MLDGAPSRLSDAKRRAIGAGIIIFAVNRSIDIAIVGGGAAGLMSAIWAGRTLPGIPGGASIVVLDGAAQLGAKILVAGGGRCNVTHDFVDERAFAGSTPAAIRKVLRSFDVPATIAFFEQLGVQLKREDTGKLFPVTDRARTVLDALLGECRRLSVRLQHPWRVQTIVRKDSGDFLLSNGNETIEAKRIICAAGGKALPKSGSDGHGYELMQRLGHTITHRVFPALVPLRLSANHFLCELKGIAADVAVEVRGGTGKVLARYTDALLCTHFGISGPVVLDASRYFLAAHHHDPAAQFVVNWLPGMDLASADRMLLDNPRLGCANALAQQLPKRLATALCAQCGIDPSATIASLSREQRRKLVRSLVDMHLPIAGDRGFTFAEVTAGGVPLSEIDLKAMASRRCDGLSICGEICDVDGRIGGYNFQWAWASGRLAGIGAAEALCSAGADVGCG